MWVCLSGSSDRQYLLYDKLTLKYHSSNNIYLTRTYCGLSQAQHIYCIVSHTCHFSSSLRRVTKRKELISALLVTLQTSSPPAKSGKPSKFIGVEIQPLTLEGLTYKGYIDEKDVLCSFSYDFSGISLLLRYMLVSRVREPSSPSECKLKPLCKIFEHLQLF